MLIVALKRADSRMEVTEGLSGGAWRAWRLDIGLASWSLRVFMKAMNTVLVGMYSTRL